MAIAFTLFLGLLAIVLLITTIIVFFIIWLKDRKIRKNIPQIDINNLDDIKKLNYDLGYIERRVNSEKFKQISNERPQGTEIINQGFDVFSKTNGGEKGNLGIEGSQETQGAKGRIGEPIDLKPIQERFGELPDLPLRVNSPIEEDRTSNKRSRKRIGYSPI